MKRLICHCHLKKTKLLFSLIQIQLSCCVCMNSYRAGAKMSEARVQPGLRLGGRVSVPLTDTGRGVGRTRARQTGITHPSRTAVRLGPTRPRPYYIICMSCSLPLPFNDTPAFLLPPSPLLLPPPPTTPHLILALYPPPLTQEPATSD